MGKMDYPVLPANQDCPVPLELPVLPVTMDRRAPRVTPFRWTIASREMFVRVLPVLLDLLVPPAGMAKMALMEEMVIPGLKESPGRLVDRVTRVRMEREGCRACQGFRVPRVIKERRGPKEKMDRQESMEMTDWMASQVGI